MIPGTSMLLSSDGVAGNRCTSDGIGVWTLFAPRVCASRMSRDPAATGLIRNGKNRGNSWDLGKPV